MKMSIYLDYNASAPIDKSVLEVMIETYMKSYGNADSRTHIYGNQASAQVERAREQVAALLKIRREEVIFTSGSTESNNMAILGMRNYAIQNNKRHIVTSTIEHKSVLEPIKQLMKEGFDVDFVKPNRSGRIIVVQLSRQKSKLFIMN